MPVRVLCVRGAAGRRYFWYWSGAGLTFLHSVSGRIQFGGDATQRNGQTSYPQAIHECRAVDAKALNKGYDGMDAQ